MTTTLEVEPGDATPEMIEQAWTEVLREIGSGEGDAREIAIAYGADPEAVASAPPEVGPGERDFGATVLVTIAVPVAIHILNGLWDDLVRPRIRQKFGVDAGPPV